MIQRQHRLDRADGLRLRDELVDVEIVRGRLQLLRTQDDFSCVDFEGGEHRIDICVGQLESDHFLAGGSGRGGVWILRQSSTGSRRLRTGVMNENERKNGEAQAGGSRSHAVEKCLGGERHAGTN